MTDRLPSSAGATFSVINDQCPVCSSVSTPFKQVGEYAFFECSGCGLIHLDSERLRRIDAGEPVREYREDYWQMESYAARERARSIAVLRMAEAVLLCCRPVEKIIDIGTGTGLILDEFAKYLPKNSRNIYGCERFPPLAQDRTQLPNYIEGSLAAVNMKFDAGLCMEVFEHLTPAMVAGLLQEISDCANDEACFFINTGLAEFAKSEDPGYVDPIGRGHIVCWTVQAVAILCKPLDLTASALPGRHWAFLIEKGSGGRPIDQRIYTPLPENVRFLNDGNPGASLLSVAAAEASRNYVNTAEALERTRWALALQERLAEATRP